MKMIISIIVASVLFASLDAMQTKNLQHSKNAAMSALAQNIEREHKEDAAASKLKTSKKSLKKPKKLSKTPSFQEYVEEQKALSTCLMNPRVMKTKYLFP